jgi:hypothetical protein
MTRTEKQREVIQQRFLRHMGRQALWASLLVGLSLAGGIAGFHHWSQQTWLDAFVNAAMLLGGMGPVGDLGPSGGKLFAGVYALYAGLVFLIVAGLLVAPVFHWVLHRFHLEDKEER